MKRIQGEDYYSVTETASILQVSVSTIRKYIHTGRINTTRIGQYLVSQTELTRLLNGGIGTKIYDR